MKLSRKHFYSGFTVLLFLFPGIILGCDLLNNSMADYFLDHTAIVGVTGFKVKTEYAMMSDETILIPPGSAKIGVNLSNSRNFSVRQELLGVPEGKHITARQIGPVEIEVNIEGAEEGDDYPLTLAMQSPDGLRDFPAYSLRIKCVSFETALRDFTVNGAVPPAFDPAKSAFRVDVSHTTVTVTFEGTTVHSGAVIEIYAGTDDSGTVLVKAAHTAEITQDLETGDNYFYVKITAPSSTAWGYVVTVYRPLDTEKMITVFYVTVGSKQYGVGTGVESGSGSISGNKITVTVPYGTDVTGMTAAASHTGTSISPDPAAARSYAAPVSYTVTAADGTTETYTVTVNAAPGDAKAITAFTVTGPVSAAGTVNEALKTVTVTVPYGTSVTAMTAAASHTGTSISPDPAAARSYAAPVSYTVTAADGTTETYTVTVSVAPSDTKAITAFTVTGPVSAAGTVNEALKTVTVTVPYGTSVTAMTAAASHTGTSISPDPAAARSYAAPVSYTVTAADGTTETYTVTVNAAPSDAKAITAFYFTVGGKNYGAGVGTESGSGSISGNTVTVTVPYGTSVTAMTAAASHTGASISPDPAAARSYAAPVSYTVTAADGTTETYTVTVSPKPGITISGITVESLSALTFSGVSASPVSASTTIAITISGGVTPDSWHVDINGPVTATHATSSFSAPSIPGFYNINVIATVGGANYSGSFGLTVDN